MQSTKQPTPTPQAENKNHPCHPLLEELRLSANNAPKEGPAAVDVLHHLLQTQVVSPQAVRLAHATLASKAATAVAAKEPPKADAAVPCSPSCSNAQTDATPPVTLDRTRHVALEIVYDGAKYSGLAQNVGQADDQSIERALFAALTKAQFITSRATAHYSRCGRTDRGVSAAGQVVALHVKSAFRPVASWDADGLELVQDDELPKNSLDKKTVWLPPRGVRSKKKKKNGTKAQPDETANTTTTTTTPMPRQQKELTEFAYDRVLNNLLPPEIRVLGWTPVTDEFSARFSAGSRTYRYFFHPGVLNLGRMRQALSYMVGRHDFRNLCKLNVEEVSNFVRKIHCADVVAMDAANSNGIHYFEIVGQAFLWHQIRCIVSVLFMVGRGLEEPQVVQELLNIQKYPGKPSYPLADERPLVLHHCAFPNLQFGYTVSNLWAVSCHQEGRWEELVLAAARIRNSLEKLGQSPLYVSDVTRFCHEKLELRRKKAIKYGQSVPEPKPPPFTTDLVTWAEALEWMKTLDLIPEPGSAKDMVHTPLLQRSCGTSYEEKVASLQNKRRSRFEENVVKKRKTKQEDNAFYDHKSKQGGSAFD